jgi:SRSO17 transposase
MVTPRREAVNTVAFIDNYCQHYYSLFEDVRHFEAFKYLQLGMLSEIRTKSLPEIAKTVGLKDGQFPSSFFERRIVGCQKIKRNEAVVNKNDDWRKRNNFMH